MELCLDSDSERKLRYIEYFMHRVNLLRYHKITPVVVFDGGNVPCKAATEEERNRHGSKVLDLEYIYIFNYYLVCIVCNVYVVWLFS